MDLFNYSSMVHIRLIVALLGCDSQLLNVPFFVYLLRSKTRFPHLLSEQSSVSPWIICSDDTPSQQPLRKQKTGHEDGPIRSGSSQSSCSEVPSHGLFSFLLTGPFVNSLTTVTFYDRSGGKKYIYMSTVFQYNSKVSVLCYVILQILFYLLHR